MSVCRQALNVFRRTLLNTLPAVSQNHARTIKRWVAPTLKELKRRRDSIGPEKLSPRSSFLEWNYDAEIFAFGKRLGEEFDKDILKKALTHRSYVIQEQIKAEQEGTETPNIPDNRQQISLGERIISDCIKNTFEKEYPQVVVQAIHNYLTTQNMLSHVASHIGLKDIVLCSDFPVEEKTLADSFKAIVGALEESSGLERAQVFVNDILLCQLNGKDIFELWDPKNPCQHLESLLKEKGLAQAEPRLCNQSAVNTILANYQVGYYCDKKLIGLGWGESIDIAKESAAFQAIRNIYTKQV